MKAILLNKKTLVFLLFIFFSTSVILFGNPDGRTGRTLKTSTSGCGSCHGSTATNDVIVTFTGPDTVNISQSVQFTLTISKTGKTGAGLDIATRRGVLAPVSNNIHLSNGELTHNNNISMTNGSVTVSFSYTAPGTSGLDTLWATGLATNSNGGTSGDDWNWSVNRSIVIRNPVGIEQNTTVSGFRLNQNYPNPFNPVTDIKFSLPFKENVNITVYDILGKVVRTLVNRLIEAGENNIEWNGTDEAGISVNSGVYFYKITAGDFTETKKMMLIK